MKENEFFLELPYGLSTTTAYLKHQLATVGLQVAQVFDLESACASVISDFHCPHSDDFPCCCELRIFCVQDDRGSKPIFLILHVHHEQSQVYLDTGVDANANTGTEYLIRSVFTGL